MDWGERRGEVKERARGGREKKTARMSKYATMVRTRGWLERETRVARERGKIRRSQWRIDEVQGPGTRVPMRNLPLS